MKTPVAQLKRQSTLEMFTVQDKIRDEGERVLQTRSELVQGDLKDLCRSFYISELKAEVLKSDNLFSPPWQR